MHPDISTFPSKAFYESRLSDGPSMDVATKQSWHDSTDLFPPYAFLHVRGSREEKGKHHSLMNRQEATVAVALYARLVQECKDIDLSQRVGIVTAYKAQVGELRKQFRTRFGQEIVDKIDFNTVDGFQGQEKDIIILSCVRGGTTDGTGIGFLSDVRRMNVALTRAKSSLFILGDAKALQNNANWGKLVEDAKERGFYREVDPTSFALRATKPQAISPTRKAAAAAAKGKKKQSDPSRFALLPAPDGLMKPGELAKNTSGLNGSTGPGTSAVGFGVKKRLMDSMKEEDTRQSDVKRVKVEQEDVEMDPTPLSNAGQAFSIAESNVKKEDSPEEGEIMYGVEYTDAFPSVSGPSVSSGQVNGISSSSLPPKPVVQAAANRPVTNIPPANQAPRPPTLVAPSKPSNSMFIPRKVR
jgi:senataxin